jgi:hypothetical protein
MAAAVPGIDAGTLSSPSWPAFLEGEKFILSVQQFTGGISWQDRTAAHGR